MALDSIHPQSAEAAAFLVNQERYLLSGEAAQEGSIAIALGRTAALAIQAGDIPKAEKYWAQLNALEPKVAGYLDMPSITDIFFGTGNGDGYLAAPEKFVEHFGSVQNYPIPNTHFSNAVGSYAFALDYLQRGDAAIVNGGDPQWIAHHGAIALSAAGFSKQAEHVTKIYAEPVQGSGDLEQEQQGSKWTDRAGRSDFQIQ